MVAILFAFAAAYTAPLRPAAPPLRSPSPRAAFVVPELSANPMSLVAVGFSTSWFLSITSSSFRESELVQKGGKLRSMKIEPPKCRPKALSPEAAAITQTFQRKYSKKDVEYLWSALNECYGSSELALQAAKDNPQMLNPAYSFPNTMLESKKVLRNVLSAEEALEVMVLNPAVLQCGPTLEPLGAAEIRAVAQLRNAGNAMILPQLRPVALGAFLLLVAATVLLSGSENAEVLAVLDVVKPLLGTLLASSFIFTAYAAARSS